MLDTTQTFSITVNVIYFMYPNAAAIKAEYLTLV